MSAAGLSTCEWAEPGNDRYMGTVAAAIAAYHLPVHTQFELIAAFESRRFDDIVLIGRDEIKGRHQYDSAIHSMHFGSRGRTCGTVTRATWSADHVESAVVVCADGECVGIPSVCLNVFRITRIEPIKREQSFNDQAAILVTEEAPPAPVFVDRSMTITVDAPSYGGDTWSDSWGGATYGPSGGGWFGGGGGGSPSAPPCAICKPCPIPPPVMTPVPEVSTWLLMLLGIGAIALMRWRR